MGQKDWENSFVDLNKNLFSADAVKGYDVFSSVENLINKSSKILDFGCGKGNLVKDFRDRGYSNSYGVDPSELLLTNTEAEAAYPGCLKKLDGSKLPFENSTFDVVYSSGVLHHIDWSDYISVFQEIRRVLKPGGHFIYLEPRKSIARSLGHVVVFSPVKLFVKQVKTLEQCLVAEWPTYSVWLDKEMEAVKLIENENFKLINYQKKMLTSVAFFRAV